MSAMHQRLRLTISIVIYAPALSTLEQTLSSLQRAVHYAIQRGMLAKSRLLVVDNGPEGFLWEPLPEILATMYRTNQFEKIELIRGHGNIGFGAGHNLAIRKSTDDFHLVLNPDVLVAEHALLEALNFLVAYPEVGLLTPKVLDDNGNMQYLCKRYPSVLILLLRGLAPSLLRKIFHKRLDHYELRDFIGDAVVLNVPIASGCFMLFRRSVLAQLKGFDPNYFLYFEDFDISLRLTGIATIAYVPSVQITHFGGYAAKKGWRHISMFLRSAVTFFNQHGWKWL